SARTLTALLGLGGWSLLQLEVEVHLGKAAFNTTGPCSFGIFIEADLAHQAIASGIGEVVPQVLVAGQVDLRGQVTVTWRGDKEVDVRRTLAMTTQQIEAFLGRAVRRAAIAGRYDAASAVAAFGVGNDAATQVVIRLALVEIGIVALGIGVPKIDRSASDRLTVHVDDLPFQEHHGGNAIFATVIHAHLPFGDRRASDIQRAFDGARGAAGQAGLLVLGILQQVEVVLQTEAGNQQTCLITATQTVEVIHRLPELILSNFQVFDDLRGIHQNAI